MSLYILTVLFLPFVTSYTDQHNYCVGICNNRPNHVLCKFPKSGPGTNCIAYIDSHLTMEEQQRVLDRMNYRRNEAALGHLLHLPTASNMMKLRWNDDLAQSAQRWADQCIPSAAPEQNDVCRDLFSWSVGQLISSIVGDAPGLRVETLVDTWYMQSLLFEGNITHYTPAEDERRAHRGFAQMMCAKSHMVGCGRAKFMVTQGTSRSIVDRLVCNFAPRGALTHRPIWMPGKPCTRCPADTACYKDYPGLCHYQIMPISHRLLDDYGNNASKSSKINTHSTETIKTSTDDLFGEYLNDNTLQTTAFKETKNTDVRKKYKTDNDSNMNILKLEKEIRDKNVYKIISTSNDDEDEVFKLNMKLDPRRYFSYGRPRIMSKKKKDDIDLVNIKSLNIPEDDANELIAYEESRAQREKTNDEYEGGGAKIDNMTMAERRILKELLQSREDHKFEINTKTMSVQIPSDEFTNITEYDDLQKTSTETAEDLQDVIQRAEIKHETQPLHVKMRRELREKVLDYRSRTTPPPPPTPTLPPLLQKLVYVFPFLQYEENGATTITANIYIICCLIAINFI